MISRENLKSLCWFAIAAFPASFSAAQENPSGTVRKNQSSVASIETYDRTGRITGRGNGFFVNKEGNIILPRHLLAEAAGARILVADGSRFPVKDILAEDLERDMILVSAEIPPALIAPLNVSSSVPKTGELLRAVPGPAGSQKAFYDVTITAARDFPVYGKILQSYGPAEEDLNGSPVINSGGEASGILTAPLPAEKELLFVIPGEYAAALAPSGRRSFAGWQSENSKNSPPGLEKLYLAGRAYFWAEEYPKALRYFEKIAAAYPGHVKAYFHIGYCNEQSGHAQEAMEAYLRSLKTDPAFNGANYNLGLAYVKLGRYEEAVKAFKRALGSDPHPYWVHYNLGRAYDKLKLYKEAAGAYKEAVRIKPDFSMAYNNLGAAYDNMELHEEEVEAYKQAVRANPALAEGYYNLGEAYYRHFDRRSEAIEAFKEAIRIKPDYDMAYNNLGTVYGDLGRHDEAIEAFRQAIRCNPDFPMAYFNLGTAYFYLDRRQEAIEAFRLAIKSKPNYAAARYNLGVAYCLIEDRESALNEYKALKGLDRERADKLFNLIYKGSAEK